MKKLNILNRKKAIVVFSCLCYSYRLFKSEQCILKRKFTFRMKLKSQFKKSFLGSNHFRFLLLIYIVLINMIICNTNQIHHYLIKISPQWAPNSRCMITWNKSWFPIVLMKIHWISSLSIKKSLGSTWIKQGECYKNK